MFQKLFSFIILIIILTGCTQASSQTAPSPTSLPSTNTIQPATATSTATPLPTPTLTQTSTPEISTATPAPLVRAKQCEEAPYSLLSVGRVVMVNTNPPLPSRIRREPNRAGELLGQAGPGEILTITAGPQCSDGYTWWRVKSQKGLVGWTVEGDASSYWLVPPSPTTANLMHIVLSIDPNNGNSIVSAYDSQVWNAVIGIARGAQALDHKTISNCFIREHGGHGGIQSLTYINIDEPINNTVRRVNRVVDTNTSELRYMVYGIGYTIFAVHVPSTEVGGVDLCLQQAEAMLSQSTVNKPDYSQIGSYALLYQSSEQRQILELVVTYKEPKWVELANINIDGISADQIVPVSGLVALKPNYHLVIECYLQPTYVSKDMSGFLIESSLPFDRGLDQWPTTRIYEKETRELREVIYTTPLGNVSVILAKPARENPNYCIDLAEEVLLSSEIRERQTNP